WEAGLQTLLNVTTVFALVIYFQRTPRDADTLGWLGITMGLAAALGGVAFYRDSNLLTVMNKNAFAMFPLAGGVWDCVPFPFATGSRLGQPMIAGLAATNTAWVFLSRSRGALLLALIAMIYLIAVTRSMLTRLVYLGAALVVAIIIASRFGSLEGAAT